MKFKQFDKQQYLTIETFRKNGQGVRTPVWFAQDGETLRIWTQADSGKVKRIRRDGKARITPSTASGESLGEWINASATIFETEEEVAKTAGLFRKKYGLAFNLFGMMGSIRRAKYATIQIKITG